jgi:hypothetical protein
MCPLLAAGREVRIVARRAGSGGRQCLGHFVVGLCSVWPRDLLASYIRDWSS